MFSRVPVCPQGLAGGTPSPVTGAVRGSAGEGGLPLRRGVPHSPGQEVPLVLSLVRGSAGGRGDPSVRRGVSHSPGQDVGVPPAKTGATLLSAHFPSQDGGEYPGQESENCYATNSKPLALTKEDFLPAYVVLWEVMFSQTSVC